MNRIAPIVLVLGIALSASLAVADDSRDRSGRQQVYFEGQLVEVNLKLMPPGASDAIGDPDRVSDFYDGFLCVCNFGPGDTVGVCACFIDPPVLPSLDEGPLYRSFALLINPDGPPFSSLTSFAQVEAAIASGAVSVLPWSALYRITVPGPKKSAIDETSWGRVKAIYH